MSTETHASVRLCLQTGEFEVHGSEDFIAKFDDLIETLSNKLSTAAPLPAATPPGEGAPLGTAAKATSQRPAEEFGEALHRLKSPTGTDQVLVAGKFAASANADGTFATRDATTLLLEQGVKLANPSQSLADNLKAKRVFKVGKNWRISRTGEEHLLSILG